MKTLSIDIETYADVNLADVGVYRYAADESFDILLFGYSYDRGPVNVIDLACGEAMPESVIKDLSDASVKKEAHNASFERICLSRYLKTELSPAQWSCSMIHALSLGLPASLDALGKALGLPEDERKMKAGKMLIQYFSKPCKPTKKNGERTRNMPWHDMEKWTLYVEYNRQDVVTQMKVEDLMSFHPVSAFDRAAYIVDQRINDRGIQVYQDLIDSIVSYNNEYQDRQLREMRRLTGLNNPNSNVQMLDWLRDRGLEMEDVRKETREAVLATTDDPVAKEVLRLKQETSMASVKKFEAMQNMVCDDGRIHGMFQFYGGRTGRWAGRGVQFQNLTKNRFKEIAEIRQLMAAREFDYLETVYDSMSDLMSQLVRPSFIPRPGTKFVVCDYSAIEARVIAWLADETWVNEVFAGDGKIYEATAAQMFGIPIDKVDKPLRQKGKVSTLALGYAGGVSAMVAMGALKMGISEKELPALVNAWRRANPHIVKLWDDVWRSIVYVLRNTSEEVTLQHGIYFRCERGYLFIGLPSGRELSYYAPRLEKEQLVYKGGKGFSDVRTHKGMFVENIVQAVARDCLAEAMMKIENMDFCDYRIVAHVHDEVIVEVPEDTAEEDFKVIQSMMSEPLSWADGLILRAAGFVSDFYMKD